MGCNSSVDAEIIISNSSVTDDSQGDTDSDSISKQMNVGLSVTFDGCASNISITVKESTFSGNLGKGILVHFKNLSTHNSLTVSSSNFTDITHNTIGASKNMHCHDMRGNYDSTLCHAGGGTSVLFDGNSSHNTIVIEKSSFSNNTAFAGGGLFVAFLTFSHDNEAKLIASTFANNGHTNLVCGGGLAIYLLNSSHHNSISIDRCNFTGNRALRGAGMYIQFKDSTGTNTLSVEKCTFVGNISPDRMGRSGGGGIEAGYFFWESYAPINNTVSIISCHFEENFANFGGGTLLFSSYAFRRDINNSFYFIDCLWKNNSANFGAAVDLTSKLTVRDHPPQGILPIPVFTNCTFQMNKVVNMDDRKGIGKGTFISTDMSAHFKGRTLFDHCSGSAIHMTSGFLIFDEHSDVMFWNQ